MGDTISRQAAIDALDCINGVEEVLRSLPSAEPTITHEQAIDYLHKTGWLQNHDRILTESKIVPSAHPDVSDINVGDMISRQAAQHKINALIDEFETIMKDIRERNVDDSVCGLCEYDGAFMSDSGNWCDECPGFERDDCFKLKDQYREEWVDSIKNLPTVQPKRGKWIERESGTEDKENGFETVIVCSRCGYPATTFYSENCESRTQIRTAFCPNCGADMRKRGEAE